MAAAYIGPMLYGGFTTSTRSHPLISQTGVIRSDRFRRPSTNCSEGQLALYGMKFGWPYCIFAKEYDLRIASANAWAIRSPMKQTWIVDRLEELGRTQAELARFMKMPPPRISEIVSGRRKIQINEFPRLIEFLGIGSADAMLKISGGAEAHVPEYLIQPAEPVPMDIEPFEFHGELYAPIPVFNIRASGVPGTLSEHAAPKYEHLFRLDWLRNLTDAPLGLLAVIQVSGDDMEPTLRQGDDILIDRRQTRIGTDGIYVYAQAEGQELFVKRFQRSAKSRFIAIRSDNPSYAIETGVSDEDISVIGRAIWIGRHLGG